MPIGAVLGMIDSAISRGETKAMNNRDREWQLKMWNLNNEYNTPLNQRKRMEAAGFSPHLVYGNGTVANTAQNQNLPDSKPLPSFGLESAFKNYVETKYMQEQTALLETQNTSLEANTAADIALKAAQTAESVGRTAANKFDLGFKESIVKYSREAARLANRQMEESIREKELSNASADERHRAAMDESAERILASKAGRSLSEQETQIKMEMRKLWQKGINPNDPAWMRVLSQMVDKGLHKTIERWAKKEFPTPKKAAAKLGGPIMEYLTR